MENNERNNTPQQRTIIEIVEFFLSTKGNFKYNIVTGYIEYWCTECNEGKILGDYEINSIHADLARNGIKFPMDSLRNLLKSNFAPRHNPFEEYFQNILPWDQKTDYIQQLVNTVKTTNDELWSIYLKKWLVALVACLLDEAVINHTMIVFFGKQGLGKTSWLLKLIPPELKDYSFSGSIDPSSKDTLIFLAEKMLINIDELEILGRTQLGSLKQLITRDSVKIRRPYGLFSENMPRRASFVSSLNHKEFLNDLTGNRRFLCFDAIQIDYAHNVLMSGVYSQAYYLWKSGFRYWFNNSDIEMINTNNEQYRMKSIEEELLLALFERCDVADATDLLSTTEILQLIFENNKNQIHNGTLQRLGKILNAYKFIKTKKAGRQVYCLKRKANPLGGYQPGYAADQAN